MSGLSPIPSSPFTAIDLAEGNSTLATSNADGEVTEITPESIRHGRNLAALAQVYLRHANPARAMVLGISAMSMGDRRPATVLMVAESLVRAGDPTQALAVLTRFENEGQLDAAPAPRQIAARHYLAARAHYWLKEPDAARDALDRALALLSEAERP